MFVAVVLSSFVFLTSSAQGQADAPAGRPLSATLVDVMPKIVKIHGAGGFRGMEAYQTGILISAEGHILTVWSHVLDTEYISITLHDGRQFDAKLLGADPRLEMAVLKIETEELSHFNLQEAVEVMAGTPILALSNLFGVATGPELVSVQHGVVSVRTTLSARRGVFETRYDGPIYVLDAITNNPGAAGGALVTRQGKLIGMLGKELRNTADNSWLNYAVPISALRESIGAIREGKFVAQPDAERDMPGNPITLAALGIVPLPDVLDRTPPYIDSIVAGSPAAAAGLKPDDLVLLVGNRLIQSCKVLREELRYYPRHQPVHMTILRGRDLIDVELKCREEPKGDK